jgi:hypothetical protein
VHLNGAKERGVALLHAEHAIRFNGQPVKG